MEGHHVQHNADGEAIKCWLVGPLKDVFFLIEFLSSRLLEIEGTKVEERELKGIVELGTTKSYKIEIQVKTYEEWNQTPRDHLNVDIVSFYEEGDVELSKHWCDMIRWPYWGKVKSLLFIGASICPAQFYLLTKTMDAEKIQRILRKVFKRAQLSKKEIGPERIMAAREF